MVEISKEELLNTLEASFCDDCGILAETNKMIRKPKDAFPFAMYCLRCGQLPVSKEETETMVAALRQIVMDVAALKPTIDSLNKEIRDYERLGIITYFHVSINEKKELDTVISVIKPVMDKALELLEVYENSSKEFVEDLVKRI